MTNKQNNHEAVSPYPHRYGGVTLVQEAGGGVEVEIEGVYFRLAPVNKKNILLNRS